jgi:hypothetical protein
MRSAATPDLCPRSDARLQGLEQGTAHRVQPWLAAVVGRLGNGTLKTYKGFPHGMPTTHAETINADLLAFLKG